jgi:hypothetical protein
VSSVSSAALLTSPAAAVTDNTAGLDAGVACSGWLVKRGQMVHNWKRRWFVLRRTGGNPIHVAAGRGRASQGAEAAGSGALPPNNAAATGRAESAPAALTVSYSPCSALLYYYKSAGDPAPKGVIPLTAGSVRKIKKVSPCTNVICDHSISCNKQICRNDGTDPDNKTGGRDWVFVLQA